jgi:16S rRNA (cytidine1402-2'-O)-methyltransferase
VPESPGTAPRRGPGRLEVIATPIGNLGDLSPRARDSLAAADLVAAEDTRRTGQLLAALGLRKPLVSLHAHNERGREAELLERLAAGETVALVSDAGTPLLSDPGFGLVRAAAAAGIPVQCLPGPTAIAAALSIAGIATDRFCFEGFLPARAGERRTRLLALHAEPRTLVFFEAPHRIAEVLVDAAAVFGAEREAAVARELTKVFETVHRGTLGGLAARAALDADMSRGEITLVVAGAPDVAPTAEGAPREAGAQAQLERTVQAALAHLPASKAAALAAEACDVPRAEAYALAVRLAALRR